MDWIVTNFTKKHRIAYTILKSGDDDEKRVNLFNEYRSWLRNYRRRNFDPFRRRTRIYFELDGRWHETTVGQLNFVYFVDTYNVLEYTRRHIHAVKQDMKQSLQQGAPKRKKAGDANTGAKKTRRRELSKNPDVQCFVYSMPVKNTVIHLAPPT